MPSSVFIQESPTDFPLWTTVSEVRAKFKEGTKVMVAIGGWGDTGGFEEAARTERGRRRFAGNVGRMVERTGADGMFPFF
jgi:GH18 family chitinase